MKPFGPSPRQFSLIPALALTVSTAVHAGRADAILVFEFTQQGSDVRLDVSGSLTGLPSPLFQASECTFGKSILPDLARISTGCINDGHFYTVAGPASFGSNIDSSFTYTGTELFLFGLGGFFGPIAVLPTTYTSGSSISGTGLFTGKTLSSLGLSSTTPGAVLGTWTIGSDSIEVRIGGAGGAAVPGPLPLFGAAAAFAHSRRLRARVRAGSSTTI